MAGINPSTNAPDDALHRLQDLRVELEQKLLQNSDYRALIAIDRALSELGSGTAKLSSPQLAKKLPEAPKKLSQTEAATEILREKGKPLPLEVLIGLLKQKGITFRGKRPELSLSATLSTHKHFRSIRYNGMRCWWFSNRPIPAPAAGNKIEAGGLANQI